MVVHSGVCVVLLAYVTLSQRTYISVILVFFDETSPCSLAVVNRGLHLGLDQTHLGHDALDRDELVDEVSFETSWSDMILSKITFKIYVINLHFLGESHVLSLVLLFQVASHLATIFLKILNFGIQLIFKHFDGFNWLLQDVGSQFRIELPDLINVD
jgi:hypothetical protein